MDISQSLNTYFMIIGVVAVGMGIYELLTKQLVGRDLTNVTKEQIRKFLPYEAGTYIIVGAFMVLDGLGKWVPFFGSTAFVIVSIAISLGVIVFYVIMSNKILGKPVKQPPHL